jgi:VanZ family protein
MQSAAQSEVQPAMQSNKPGDSTLNQQPQRQAEKPSSQRSSQRAGRVSALVTDVLHGATWRPAWSLLTAVALLSISWLAFTPNPPPAADLGWDKANHFAAFGTLAFLGMQCLRARPSRPGWVLAALLAFGVLIELVQSQVPGRDADAQDVLADMIGAVIGLLVHAAFAWLIVRLITRRSAG